MAYPSIVTPYAILSFPQVFAPKARAEGQDPVYSASLIFDEAAQKTPEFKALKASAETAAKDRFPKLSPAQLMMPFRDAGEKDYQGYDPGKVYINPWSNRQPPVIDARKQRVLLPEQVFAGQRVRALVAPFAWEKAGKRGVSFGLNSLQIVTANMPRIDGTVSPEKAFNDLPEEDIGDDESIPF